jgi:toxin ParE1/3/4
MKSSHRIGISDEAAADLLDIRRYTAKVWGPQQRDRYIGRLRQSLHSLLDYPERGRRRDELYFGCPSLTVGQHIVYYYLTDDEIVIDRVLHVNQETAGKVGP